MVLARLHDPIRMCVKCGLEKSFDHFRLRKNRYGKPQRQTWCLVCDRLLARNLPIRITEETRLAIEAYRRAKIAHYKQERYDKKYNRHLMRKYGITIQQYSEMFAAQGGVCAICRSPARHKTKSKLNVDHCHSTGAVRGLLCDDCNHGLGAFRDDIDRMLRAISYISKTQFTEEEF